MKYIIGSDTEEVCHARSKAECWRFGKGENCNDDLCEYMWQSRCANVMALEEAEFNRRALASLNSLKRDGKLDAGDVLDAIKDGLIDGVRLV